LGGSMRYVAVGQRDQPFVDSRMHTGLLVNAIGTVNPRRYKTPEVGIEDEKGRASARPFALDICLFTAPQPLNDGDGPGAT
jgi:hypothetical protein